MVELTRPTESARTSSSVDMPHGLRSDEDGESTTPDKWANMPIGYEFLARYERSVRLSVNLVVVTVGTIFVLLQLGPTDLLSDTTPAGGDMGAHVWGPAFLRDELLPDFQIAGWAPDWYAGFAAFQFYMVLPMLAIVALDVGVVELASVPGVVVAVLAAAWAGVAVGMWPDRRWRFMAVGVPIAAVLLVALPYGVAFKLVAVSGPLTLPLAAYAFGHLAGLRFPGPALLAVGTLPYLFYQGYSIYGGNLASMLAGEFAFSMSLSLALVYLGLVFRGLETGRHRALAALLLALTGLCHIIPALWVLAGTVVVVALRPRYVPGSLGRSLGLLGAGAAIVLVGLIDRVLGGPLSALPGLVSWDLVVMAAGAMVVLGAAWLCSESTRWLLPPLVVGGLLSAFWVVPFLGRAAFVNDMGWEKLGEGDGSGWDRWGQFLLPGIEADSTPAKNLLWMFGLAVVGAILGVVLRSRVGVFLTAMTTITGVAFVVMPEARLWNGRILPFYYLTAMLLAFLAVALVIHLLFRSIVERQWKGGLVAVLAAVSGVAVAFLVWHAKDGRVMLLLFDLVVVLAAVAGIVLVRAVVVSGARTSQPLPEKSTVSTVAPASDDAPWAGLAPPPPTSSTSASTAFRLLLGACGTTGALAAVLLVVGLPLGAIPFSEPVRETAESPATGYRWPALSLWQIHADVPSEVNVPKWATWNFRGYEGKDEPSDFHEDMWTEYSSMISTMERLGEDEDHGCGRALWEYNLDTLEPYGTPMAPMLLPYWTDGCIGSMEGLYFEASMTTPYHFLMQAELSESPSSAQRDMPYGGFNMDLGVRHLQMMGVKYYMATTELAIEAAREHPALTEVATSEPWEVFEVANSDLVTPMAYEPAVLAGAGHSASDWLDQPVAYQAPGAQQGRLPEPGEDREDVQPGPWPLAPEGWSTSPPPTVAGAGETAEPAEYFFGPSVQWFLNPAAWDVPLTVDGPSEWQRVDLDEAPEWRSVRPAEVADIEVSRDEIAFEVDEPGSPVLVKASYFPNWEASGADGPWRVAPNLMVVVPTDEEVTLSYGTTSVEYFAYLLTLIGLVGVVVLARRGVYRYG